MFSKAYNFLKMKQWHFFIKRLRSLKILFLCKLKTTTNNERKLGITANKERKLRTTRIFPPV